MDWYCHCACGYPHAYILKPLEAEIKLFDTGKGFLKLDEEKIELKETQAGHYTVDVSALGKLCYVPNDVKVNHGFECRMCDELLNSRSSLNLHVDTEHGGSLQCDLCDDILKCKERNSYISRIFSLFFLWL